MTPKGRTFRAVGRPLLALVLAAGTASSELPSAAAATSPPAIDIWYGDVQHVGARGRSQEWANVLGRVTDPDDAVTSLSYSLNGGPSSPLMMGGSGHPRLVRAGDFNVELDRDALVEGRNSVSIRARDASGAVSTKVVTLVSTDGQAAQLPTFVDWDQATSPTDVVDVVDGRWQVTPSGARVVNREHGYDRLLAVGDTAWTDYEIEVPVTIHKIHSGNSGVGFLTRWTGHTDDKPHVEGMQPLVGWTPSGALAWYRRRPNQPARVEIANADESLLAVDRSGFALQLGTTYTFRATVRRLPTGDEYRLKVFQQGQPESSGVELLALDPEFRKANGSILLVAHRMTVTFGDVAVSPVGGAPAPSNIPPRAVDDSVSTPVGSAVVVDVLANDDDSDGTLDPRSVTVTQGPASGAVAVNATSGMVTYDPDPGFQGSDTFLYNVKDDAGATSNTATVSVSVGDSPPAGLVSDDFSAASLGSHWTLVDPRGDASVTMTGTSIDLGVPAGLSHDLWTGALWAPRLLQDVDDGDFEVEVKIRSAVTARYQMQGLVVQQDSDDLLRFDVHHDGSSPRFFVGKITAGKGLALHSSQTSMTGTYWLRVRRVGDAWTFRASGDGASWVTIASFTHAMGVAQVGMFAGNHERQAVPAHTASFDHFRDVGSAQ